ncbi:MAG: 4'-phosphopantetheinyl transferase superfamily protein [Spirosomaceae bacterium]|jgi:phosphopantetheinyl transferase|nr:4'-phosphopantetheinyl transferase superfamily protein [Spirosomataceae bacterium]
MPIHRQWTVFGDCHLLIWEITETPADLRQNLEVTPNEWEEFIQISHPQKQLEWLAGRKAMQTLIESQGLPYAGMTKDDYGKPHLRQRVAEISLTHTAHFIGVVMHPTRPVGIDLERIADKLARVAPKFLSGAEKLHAQNDLRHLCTYWCAKEALYKLHGTRQLSFKEEIGIEPFADTDPTLTGYIYPHQTSYRLHRFEIEDFIGIMAV